MGRDKEEKGKAIKMPSWSSYRANQPIASDYLVHEYIIY
jgi:hypothetical protein